MKIIATQVRDGASAETKIRQNDADDDNPADDIDDGIHDVPLSVVWRAGRLAGSLRRRGFIRVDARRLGIGMGCKAVFAANIEIFARKPTPQTARAK